MDSWRVKLNLSNGLPVALAGFALISFLASWAGLFPAALVENLYSRELFPFIAWWMSLLTRTIGGSLMDWLLPAVVLGVVYMLVKRKLFGLLAVVATAYLIFFWTWGLNYHRLPLESKLAYREDAVTAESIEAFIQTAADEINRAYRELPAFYSAESEDVLIQEADSALRSVLAVLDGPSPLRRPTSVPVKTSHILNPLLRAGSVSGMFNPFGHEALVTEGLLPAERPMVMLHEIAHLRGYAHEGEANFVAFLAAVHSDNPRLNYSGWLGIWMYLSTPENDRLLDPGPRLDLEAIYERIRQQRVEWISRTQSQTLDALLKVHRVEEGVRSYADIVRLAVGTYDTWDRFE